MDIFLIIIICYILYAYSSFNSYLINVINSDKFIAFKIEWIKNRRELIKDRMKNSYHYMNTPSISGSDSNIIRDSS
jgi:hypothetical protein